MTAHFAIAGSIAAVLDERVAQELLLEDLLVFGARDTAAVAVADHVTRLRTFQSANRMLKEHSAGLKALGNAVDFEGENPVVAAARWYLRAAQLGPVADAIVFFWIALEALAKPPYGTKLSAAQRHLSDVDWVEDAIREAGVQPTDVSPTVGRLAGLRAEIVHGGAEHPALLSEGYYALEQLVRLLLRHRLDIAPYGWPLTPDASNLRPPLKYLADALHQLPETQWTRAAPERSQAP